MAHYINDKGQFQSDKYPDLPPDKIVLSFNDLNAHTVLGIYAQISKDEELAEDIIERLRTI